MYSIQKQELIDYGNKLIADGYTLGTGGNLSTYIRQDEVMLITPSGIPFDKIELPDIVTMRLDGTIVQGHRRPSSEWRMHGSHDLFHCASGPQTTIACITLHDCCCR